MKRKNIFLIFALSLSMAAHAQNYNMKVSKQNGDVITIPTDQIKDVTFEVAKPKPADPKEEKPRYITMGGLKWAAGNLMYDNGQWKIAANQWEYFNMVYGRQAESNNQCKLLPNRIDHFSWGVLGEAAFVQGKNSVKAYNPEDGVPFSISGKMYKDAECKQETNDFAEAKYGDLAFWATKGRWRMPSVEEWRLLEDACDWQLGYITLEGNKQLYGCLLTPAKGMFGEKNLLPREFTKEEVNKNLFLPYAGYRYEKVIRSAAYGGYYWSSQLFDKTSNLAFEASYDRDGFYIVVNGGDINSGNCIRPILVERE